MKSLLFFFASVLLSIGSFAQSSSFQTLKDKFKGQPDVHSFSISGWLGRTILMFANEEEFSPAIKDLKSVRLITIPKSEFASQRVTVNGFKIILKQDYFQELAYVRNNGDKVSIYLREGNNHKNHYFVLAEESDEVVAMELTGYIDLKQLNPRTITFANNKNIQ